MKNEFFDTTEERFQTMRTKYGIWPTTVWECSHQDKVMQALKKEIGDVGGVSVDNPEGRRRDHASFPGEIGRSGKHGKYSRCKASGQGFYVGTEIRQEEVEAVNVRCSHCNVSGKVKIIHGDGRDCPQVSDSSADFCYTCPPYYDLEKYEGGENDLSMVSTYESFLDEIEKVVVESCRILKGGAYSCWVVGLHRNKKGGLLALNHDIARIHQKAGFRFKEEIIVSNTGSGAIQRVGTFDKGDRRLIRTHEYVLVFVKE